MAHKKNTTNLTELLLQCVTQPDPMLSMLEWLCTHLMEAEVDQQLGAEKSQRTDGRSGYRSGYRPRRLDTRMGTMYLMVPKVRQGGYIPFFVTERKRSEAMLVQVVQEAFVQGVSTRKMEKLAHSLGIENLSRSQVSEMTKGLNEQVEEFRNRSLADTVYPVLWVDALYEKVRVDGRIVSMAVLIVCGVDENGHRDIIAVEPMAEESKSSYGVLFQNLRDYPEFCVTAKMRCKIELIFQGGSGVGCARLVYNITPTRAEVKGHPRPLGSRRRRSAP